LSSSFVLTREANLLSDQKKTSTQPAASSARCVVSFLCGINCLTASEGTAAATEWKQAAGTPMRGTHL
jgi:hypothetical protein